MIRTLKFPLQRNPANSRAIGYMATQQNAAYNHAVNTLNRTPNLPKRSGKNAPDAIAKRITAWRQANREATNAPYNIHQKGGEDAWEANQSMQKSRAERLARIDKAETKGVEPKRSDIRPHRRTLKRRRRKTSRLTLAITDRKLFQISENGQTIASRQCGFTLRLRGEQTLKGLNIRSLQLVSAQDYSARAPLEKRHYCLHVQVWEPNAPLEGMEIQSPEDILGCNRGVRNNVTLSNAARVHNLCSRKRSQQRRRHQRRIAGKPQNSKRRHKAIAKNRERARRYAQRRNQDLRRQIYRILTKEYPEMVAIDSLDCISMMASARGTVDAPGKNVAAKRKLNESLAAAAIGYIGKLLHEEAAKLGIPTVSVPPQGISQTCPKCGTRRPNNRKSQAVFRCQNCRLNADRDWTAAVVVRNRAYVRYCEWRHGFTPSVEEAPTGWREQPSRAGSSTVNAKRVQAEGQRDDPPRRKGP